MDAALFIDPLGLAIVGAGSLLLACARASRADIAAALAALGPLATADPERDSNAARVAVGRIERIAEVRDLSCADRLETAQAFLRTCARHLSDMPDPHAFAAWGQEELAARTRRHEAAAGWWRTLADAAPAMGLIGTVIGLVRLFAAMDDVGAVGPAMALALLTTLYGAVLATLIAGPVAARLERLSEAELAWQRRTVAHLVRLAEAEQARTPHLRPVRTAA